MRLLSIIFWLVPATALAGDPCPIIFDVYESTPDWRQRDADLAALQSKEGIMGFVYKGLRITEVLPGGPAQEAGLQVSDIITAVNSTPVRDHAHAEERFRGEEKTVHLTIGRNNETIPISIEKKPADPLLMHMLQMVSALTTGNDRHSMCLQMRRGTLNPEQQGRINKAAFTESRGFQCADAHTRLPTSAFGGQQPLIMIRGSTRILLTVPDWGTSCVAVSDYDGDRLTHQRVLELVQDVGKRYIQDRHDNP